MGLFGPKVQLGLELDRDTFACGETIAVRWSASGEDAKARSCRLELGYDNRYRYESTDSDGSTSTSSRTNWVPVHVLDLAPGSPPVGTHAASFELPATPASAPKGVAWKLRLLLDRPGRDVVVERPITVRASAAGLEAWARTEQDPADREVVVHVTAEPRLARPGETIRGRLDIRATEEVTARTIRVELMRRREEQDDLFDETAEATVQLGADVALGPNQPLQLPFELQLPADAQPSFEAEHNSQHWYVCGVVDRRMRSDFAGLLEVVVHDA